MPRDLMGDGRYNIKVKVIGRKEKTVVVTASGKGSRALEATASGKYNYSAIMLVWFESLKI